MRQTYELSDATRKTLTDRAADFAEEMSKSSQYFHAILSGTETDVFARFEPMYAAACRLNVNCHWKARLNAIEQRHAPFTDVPEPAECVREKILTQTRILDKYIDSMSDGKLDLYEIIEIEPLIEPAIKALEHLRESLSFQRGLLEAENDRQRKARNGNGAANARRN